MIKQYINDWLIGFDPDPMVIDQTNISRPIIFDPDLMVNDQTNIPRPIGFDPDPMVSEIKHNRLTGLDTDPLVNDQTNISRPIIFNPDPMVSEIKQTYINWTASILTLRSETKQTYPDQSYSILTQWSMIKQTYIDWPASILTWWFMIALRHMIQMWTSSGASPKWTFAVEMRRGSVLYRFGVVFDLRVRFRSDAVLYFPSITETASTSCSSL